MAAPSDPRMALLEASERLGRVARDVKEKQLRQTGGAAKLPAPEPQALHPEEAWLARFATHAIRPGKPLAGAPPLSRFAVPPVGVPEAPVPPSVEARKPAERGAPGHIGGLLGKAGPRRRWAARLFGRR